MKNQVSIFDYIDQVKDELIQKVRLLEVDIHRRFDTINKIMHQYEDEIKNIKEEKDVSPEVS